MAWALKAGDQWDQPQRGTIESLHGAHCTGPEPLECCGGWLAFPYRHQVSPCARTCCMPSAPHLTGNVLLPFHLDPG